MPRVPSPAVLHAPVSQATPGERLRLTVELLHPDRVQKASVHYRVGQSWHEVDLLRGEGTEHEAWVPAEHVAAPGLAYTVVVEYLDGSSVEAFATRAAPHPVQVVESALDVIERARLARLGGRRSEFTLSGDGVEFGSREANADGTRPEDHYYRIEFGYTYRLLRRISEISMRLGAVRGEAPVPDADVNPAKDDPYEVGLYYAEPGFRVMLAEQLHLDAWFVLGINQRGFGAGLGAAALIGEPYGQHFAVGGESIDGVGARAWIRLQVPLTRSLHLSPILEATEMPSADSFGLRTLGELGWVSDGGVRVALRGGYQARDFTGGGPAGGATVGYAF